MNIFSKIIKSSKIKDDYFISLDIGSETVKALILHSNRKELEAHVIGVGEILQKNGNIEGNKIKNISAVTLDCKKAIEKAVFTSNIKPKKVVIGISGGFVMGMSLKMKYQRNKPKLKIDMKEMQDTVQKMYSEIFDKIEHKTKKDFQNEKRIKIANSSIVDISIDGYRVMSPLGFKGHEIEFSVFNSFLYNDRFDILKRIAKDLQLELLDIVSTPFAVATAIGAQDDIKFNAILIDIGGRTTNVAIVHQGNIEGTSNFNIGGRAFTKSLSEEMKISMEDAEELKIGYSSDQVDKEKSKRIKEIFAFDCGILLTGVEISLQEFSNSNLLPTQIILYGGGSRLDHIDEIINTLLSKKNLPYLSKSKIKFVNLENITNIIDETGKSQSCQYVNSLSLANFVLEVEENDENINMILRKMVKRNY